MVVGWTTTAAQRARFVLDFGYATGPRANELVAAKLVNIETDAHDDVWLHLLGKGAKAGNRLWSIVGRFFKTAADVVEKSNPILAEKLRRASRHWMHHIHATHALQRSAAQRRADHRAGQPAPRVDRDNVDVSG